MRRVLLMGVLVLAGACADDDVTNVVRDNAPAYASVNTAEDFVTVDFGYLYSYMVLGAKSRFFTVPVGVDEITVEAYGAQGGAGTQGSPPGGLGGKVVATIPVTPGQILTINVGVQGGYGLTYVYPYEGGFVGGGMGGPSDLGGYPGGWRAGGGGGGASEVRIGDETLIVAAGGGGSGGGPGGGAGGAGGYPARDGGKGTGDNGGWGGHAGYPGTGVASGGFSLDLVAIGGNGTTGQGGNGGGGDAWGWGGGGGGGGAMGGGGGAGTCGGCDVSNGGGGGGGVSKGPTGAEFATGVREGHGLVRLTYVVKPPDGFTTATSISAERPERTQFAEPVTFTASVTTNVDRVVTMGIVRFYRLGNCTTPGYPLGEATVENGTASIVVTSLPPGLQDVLACYEGVPNEFKASQGALQHEITTAGTGTTLVVTPSSITTATTLALTAHVTYGDGITAAVGSVSLYRGGSNCTAPGTLLGTINGGMGTVITNDLPAGHYSILACYSGYPGMLGHSSAIVEIDVSPAIPTTLTLTADPADGAKVGEAPHFNAFVTDVNGVPVSSGEVMFYLDNGTCADQELRFGGATLVHGKASTQLFGAAAGSYVIRACFADRIAARYQSSEATIAYEVTEVVVNQPPVISSAGGPYHGAEGQAISFTATASDADGDALTYQWAFGDGSTAEGAMVTHAYADNGNYNVALTVSDGTIDATSSTTASVDNVAPTASLSAPAMVNQGVTIQLALNGGSDVAADIGSLEYGFTCDGTSWSAFSSTATASCPTSRAGSADVGGRVRDKDGGVTTYTASVGVTNITHTIAEFAGASLLPGETYQASSSFSDQGDDSPYTVTVAYGDGTTEMLVHDNGVFTLSHSYASAGTFSVKVTVTDAHGVSASATATVTVMAPVAAVQQLNTVVANLVDTGSLRASYASPLRNLLNNAGKQLAAGRKQQAIQALDNFIAKVNEMVPAKLDAADGAALTAYATRLKASM